MISKKALIRKNDELRKLNTDCKQTIQDLSARVIPDDSVTDGIIAQAMREMVLEATRNAFAPGGHMLWPGYFEADNYATLVDTYLKFRERTAKS